MKQGVGTPQDYHQAVDEHGSKLFNSTGTDLSECDPPWEGDSALEIMTPNGTYFSLPALGRSPNEVEVRMVLAQFYHEEELPERLKEIMYSLEGVPPDDEPEVTGQKSG
ncbi:hypothetical protein K461DRAFT_283205 [Myriangium duriaei CBS 260.36]|uniref:Uncharacterized protein n=1 Tax=Myriangium duriaei CBS 260.36 TaxID=1168546 RepID=A0A9P4IWQ4_9PEZI|nr:hypothetical protein K461DRAFT_283205 [Myriangium duriaei CBS 260.36]